MQSYSRSKSLLGIIRGLFLWLSHSPTFLSAVSFLFHPSQMLIPRASPSKFSARKSLLQVCFMESLTCHTPPSPQLTSALSKYMSLDLLEQKHLEGKKKSIFLNFDPIPTRSQSSWMGPKSVYFLKLSRWILFCSLIWEWLLHQEVRLKSACEVYLTSSSCSSVLQNGEATMVKSWVPAK